MTVMNKNGFAIAVIDPDVRIGNPQDLLDLFVLALYEYGSDRLIVYKETLGEDFFKLRTGVAGELLQKCSNFRMRLAIVGDFSEYTSKSLGDFIYESNQGNLVYFANDLDSAAEVLVKNR